jgi:hypothetical protein
MSRNTDVFQVLVPTTIKAGNGATLDDLAVGEMAAFDYDTNLQVNASVPNYYYALAYTNSDGVKDIVKSSGTHIQTKNEVSLTKQCYVAPVNKRIELSGWTAQCNEEYMIRFEIRNQEAYRLNGYNQVIKAYTTVSPDCVDCNTDCPNGDCFQVAADLINQVNADPDAVFSAEIRIDAGKYIVTTAAVTTSGTITVTTDGNAVAVEVLDSDTIAQIATKIAAAINADGTHVAFVDAGAALANSVIVIGAPLGAVLAFVDTDTTGTVATDEDVNPIGLSDIDNLVAPVAAYNAANPTAQVTCPTMRFDVNPSTFSTFCDINLNYFFPRQTDATLVGVAGFEGNSTIITEQEMVYEDGSGYDVKQLEYEAGGWNGAPGPYRVYNDGLAQTGFRYFADQAVGYNLVHLSHDQHSISGWRGDTHFERTIFALTDAVEVAATVLINAMAGANVEDILPADCNA